MPKVVVLGVVVVKWSSKGNNWEGTRVTVWSELVDGMFDCVPFYAPLSHAMKLLSEGWINTKLACITQYHCVQKK